MARPSKWSEIKEKINYIRCMAMEGKTNEEIADELGIGMTTFYKYQKEHGEFANALKKNKPIADSEVKDSLFRRAKGYWTKEIKKVINPDGSEIITEITKEIPPDTTAAIFWLKNREPENFRDKQEIVNTVQTIKVIPPDFGED